MITTYSGWNYGHTITLSNQNINFEEDGGSGPLNGKLLLGSYTLEEFATELSRAMNEAGSINSYLVTIDRTTRKLTITSDTANFSLLIDSGDQKEVGVFTLAGFNGADLLGAMSYEGDSPSGSQFIPQFKIQDYTPFPDIERTANANVNENTKGDVVEVINYGSINSMECNILFQTNITPQSAIREDSQGKEKLLDFLRYLKTKSKVEFMEDAENSPDVFTNCILEKTRLDPKGLGYKLENMRSVGWTNYYTTQLMEFRQVQ